MFTAMLLVCAVEVRSSDTCYIHVADTIFKTREECQFAIEFAKTDMIDMIEWFDPNIEGMWKITDSMCTSWGFPV